MGTESTLDVSIFVGSRDQIVETGYTFDGKTN